MEDTNTSSKDCFTVNNDEIIYLFDLTNRWQGALNEEIIAQNKSGLLPSYWLKKQTATASYLCHYELKYREEGRVVDTHINGTQRGCVFLLNDVENVEKSRPDFLEKRTDIDEYGQRIQSVILENMQNKANKEIRSRDDKIKDLLNEIELLKAGISEREDFSHGIRRDSYNKMIAGLFKSIGISEIDLHTAGTIAQALEKSGVALSNKTIKAICDELVANSLLPRAMKKKEK